MSAKNHRRDQARKAKKMSAREKRLSRIQFPVDPALQMKAARAAMSLGKALSFQLITPAQLQAILPDELDLATAQGRDLTEAIMGLDDMGWRLLDGLMMRTVNRIKARR